MANSNDPFGGGWGDTGFGNTGRSGSSGSSYGGNGGFGSGSGSSYGTRGGFGSGSGNSFNSGNTGPAMYTQGKKVFNRMLLILSAVFGIIAMNAALTVYGLLEGKLFRPLSIGITLAVFLLIMVILVFVSQNVRGAFGGGQDPGKMIVAGLISVVVILLAGTLFEFIYELGGKAKFSNPGSYIIVIDDSGSMEGSDPGYVRYAAIETILEDTAPDFPYAVYSFNSDVRCIREMAPRSQGEIPASPGIGGGTAIRGTLLQIADDLENGDLKKAKDPKVLFLSDGAPTDMGLFRDVKPIIKAYQKLGVSISTVGLGGGASKSLMKQIAQGTGGVCISVDDVNGLKAGMKTAIESFSGRDLLTLRIVPGMDILYCIERIVFMGLLGLGCMFGILSAAGLLLDKTDDLAFMTSLIRFIPASLLLELLIQAAGVPEEVADRLWFLIISLIFSTFFKRERNAGIGDGGSKGGSYQDGPDRGQESGFSNKFQKKKQQGPFGFN